ncbi:hypothetical protein GCM10027026_16510 [Myroides odoratimimus subsp. xuanwuensis]
MIPGGPRDDPRRKRALAERAQAERQEPKGAEGARPGDTRPSGERADGETARRACGFRLPEPVQRLVPTIRSARSA